MSRSATTARTTAPTRERSITAQIPTASSAATAMNTNR